MFNNFGLAFVAIFVALDIIGVLPLFASMTRELDPHSRRSIVDISMLVALLTALAFALIGEGIFNFLRITMSDFKIAGGLVLLLLSLTDLVRGPETAHQTSGSTGVVPLAVPLITGPAVITTMIFQVRSVGYLVAILALISNYFIAWMALRQSEKVTRLIGKDGTMIISKIVALLLVSISVSLIRSGILEAVKIFQTT